jgi:ankyrin repeat protein
MCKFLLESGADVNAKGGDAVATPAMWAAQRCNYYVVNLLLQHGADPLLTDAQGYNLLHLATFDGHVFLIILLLHQNIPIDTPDRQGHTCLMWAAYKGFPAVVDLFLRWGASVETRDENGFTPLHWSLVTRSQPCIQKLIEYGSDRFAETTDGKTPYKVATEMDSTRMWFRALSACGYETNGKPKEHMIGFLMRPNILTKFYFFLPFFTLFAAIYMVSGLPIFAGVPFTLLFLYSAQWFAQKLLQGMPLELNHIQKTPFLAGIFAATAFWVGFRWLTTILPSK